eukprot:scaffold1596_cov302-Pinguiococcus_pyrenoidosus.AAC.52
MLTRSRICVRSSWCVTATWLEVVSVDGGFFAPAMVSVTLAVARSSDGMSRMTAGTRSNGATTATLSSASRRRIIARIASGRSSVSSASARHSTSPAAQLLCVAMELRRPSSCSNSLATRTASTRTPTPPPRRRSSLARASRPLSCTTRKRAGFSAARNWRLLVTKLRVRVSSSVLSSSRRPTPPRVRKSVLQLFARQKLNAILATVQRVAPVAPFASCESADTSPSSSMR